MQWSSFDGDEVAALTRDGTTRCPGCGADALRRYLTTPERARRPTLVSYVWCGACRKFVGTRTARPEGLSFTDPLAALSAADRRDLERSLTGFLDHLDRLWEDGVLPQQRAS